MEPRDLNGYPWCNRSYLIILILEVVMLNRHATALLASALVLLGGCGGNDREVTTLLTGRAVLPADTIIPGPPVGRALETEINGRRLPLPGVPVQGFSSIIRQSGDRYLVLQDNGFGTLANSPDVPLQWFHLKVEWAEDSTSQSQVTLLNRTLITDPKHFLSDVPDDGRLTGAHLDPESFVRIVDGSFWIGDEFGPSLVHVDSLGQILEPVVDIPVVEELVQFSRGHDILMTPDHPDLRHQAEADQLANLPRSGGIEGLAITPDGNLIYASVEKAMIEDPSRRRRVILQFDPRASAFTTEYRLYKVDAPDVSIASLEAVSASRLLVLERDSGEGINAVIKRVYQVDLDNTLPDGTLDKTLVCDLMNIKDRKGLTTMEDGAIGLGSHYSFPYVTPECLLILDKHHLMVVNDNNYPMSCGRRPPRTPDDNEFIRLHLEHSLKP